MCEKIEYMRELAMAQGKEEGKAEGRAEGILEAIISLVKDGLISVAEGAKRANMSVAEFEAKLAQA